MSEREAPAAIRRAEQLELLLAASERLNAAPDSDAVLQQLVQAAAHCFPARLVAALTREGTRAVCRHWRTYDSSLQGPFETPLDGSALGGVFDQGESIWSSATADAPALTGSDGAVYHPAATFAVPVVTRSGAVSAVLAIFDLPVEAVGQDGPGEDGLWLARGIAKHAAIALERAELSAGLARTTRALALLEERARVAMDLHDGAIQSLYGIMLGLAAQARTLNASLPAARTGLERAVEQLTGVIQDIRSYISGLYAQELGARGLPAGLETLVDDLRGNAHLDASLEMAVELEEVLEPEAVAHVLQFAREAASNVIRHAGARRVCIVLSRAGSRASLSVSDDGHGFDPDAPRSGHGRGLQTMAERARRLGGTMTIHSAPGEGTEVRLDIPLTTKHTKT